MLGGSQKKIYDYPITLSGFAKNGQACMTFIELPEIFDNQDILSTTEHVKNRCFDRTIVYIDARMKRPKSEKMKILMAQINFLDLVYGEKFVKSLSVLMLVSKRENARLKTQSEIFVKKLFKEFVNVPKVSIEPFETQGVFSSPLE